MDDRRIENALRQGPPDEPAYLPGARQAMTDDAVNATRSVRRSAVSARRGVAGRVGWLLPLAAVVAISVAGLALRLNTSPGATQTPGPSDLLHRITGDGVVHIAVTRAAPQAETAGGAIVGFDVDVAKAVAEKLGVRVDLEFLSPAAILRGEGTWELAFPSHGLPPSLPGARTGPAYYVWPAWLAVEASSPVSSIGALDGSTICVVRDAPGADWLTGASSPDTTYLATVPLEDQILERATDAECVAALASGAADALVTANLLDSDLAGRGLRPIAGRPVIEQQRSVLIRISADLGDPTNLQAALEAAFIDLRTQGRLAELSRQAFGGLDLTGATR